MLKIVKQNTKRNKHLKYIHLQIIHTTATYTDSAKNQNSNAVLVIATVDTSLSHVQTAENK
jgi:hypothetical protein